MKKYAPFNPTSDKDFPAIYSTLEDIIAKRQEDVARLLGIENLNSALRKVVKIPSSSTDIVASIDLLGDFNYDANYLYIVVSSGGALVWRRITLGVF